MGRIMVSPEPPNFWTPLLYRCHGLAPRQARRLWRACIRCTHPEVVAWRYTLGRADEQLSKMTDADLKRFIAKDWSPPTLIKVLEHLVTEGLLQRTEANHLEDAILKSTNKQGSWKH